MLALQRLVFVEPAQIAQHRMGRVFDHLLRHAGSSRRTSIAFGGSVPGSLRSTSRIASTPAPRLNTAFRSGRFANSSRGARQTTA